MNTDDQLQELYHYLDHHTNGNLYLAWYGQARAKEMSHPAALQDTIDHFHLDLQPWFQTRGGFVR